MQPKSAIKLVSIKSDSEFLVPCFGRKEIVSFEFFSLTLILACSNLLDCAMFTEKSHGKLLLQVEEAIEILLNDAQRRITATHEASLFLYYRLWTWNISS